MMGNRIHMTRVVDGFSSHTLAQPARRRGAASDLQAVREKLIAALVEVVAEGGDPRLV